MLLGSTSYNRPLSGCRIPFGALLNSRACRACHLDGMSAQVTFVGGRLLYTTDGQPIGQIAYYDGEGRLTAFCIKRNPTRSTQGLKQEQFFGRLQMIHWQDETFQYAVVGFADFETLEPVAAWLEGNYREDA